MILGVKNRKELAIFSFDGEQAVQQVKNAFL
jgi:CheY-like chemotaxis protein